MAHIFLSDEWLDAIEALRDEQDGDLPLIPLDARINVTVRDTPFSDEPRRLHVDTSDGYPVLVREHVEPAELNVTTDYATAADLFVARQPERIVKAFFEGRILVQGDVTKLMALQEMNPPTGIDEAVGGLAAKIIAMTEIPAG